MSIWPSLILAYECDGFTEVLELDSVGEVKGKYCSAIFASPEYKTDEFEVMIYPIRKIRLLSLSLIIPFEFHTFDRVLANGFQSWSETRTYGMDEKMERLSSVLYSKTNRSGDYSFVEYGNGAGEFHSHLFSWLRRPVTEYDSDDHSLFVGSLDESSGYTVIRYSAAGKIIRIEKDCGGQEISGEWKSMHVFIAQGQLDLLAKKWKVAWGLPGPKVERALGWTSWYNYFTDIDEPIILHNLQNFIREKIPIRYFQIDDGWQTAVGDWTSVNAKFPRGLHFLADEIKVAGFVPGIWWAPFICSKNSRIYIEHRNWLVTSDDEHLVSGGYNPGWAGALDGDYFILDIYNQEVRDYLKKCADVLLNEWGFEMIKSDFLFASGFWPRNGKSRGVIMNETMEFLREICGDKIILGCGVPLGPAIGKVDYCRIGPDIGMNWDMKSLKVLGVKERISTRNAIRNTILRSSLDGLGFLNDTDVFILRKEKNSLSAEQRDLLFSINRLFGSLIFSSDDISLYSTTQMELYRTALERENPEKLSVIEFRDGQIEIYNPETRRMISVTL